MCLVFLAFFICLLTKSHIISSIFFFFNDTATTEIYTLSLHDALPIYGEVHLAAHHRPQLEQREPQVIFAVAGILLDRKSTRLNSSHQIISYAVFCLKKKNTSTDSINSETMSSPTSKSLAERDSHMNHG